MLQIHGGGGERREGQDVWSKQVKQRKCTGVQMYLYIIFFINKDISRKMTH